MNMIQNETAQAIAYFSQEPLRHLVHLKYLAHHPGKFDARYLDLENEGSQAALLNGSVNTTAWDQGQYPDLELLLLPSATDEAAAQHLLERVRADFSVSTTPTLFKFCDPYCKLVFTTAFPLHPARKYISFTTRDDARIYQSHPEVAVGSILDDARVALYQQNGYTLDELQTMFDQGALTFGLYEGNDLVSTCLAYRNFEEVWEIGGIRTVDSARRKGYAHKVVETALHELNLRGLVPRYHVENINTASIALAQSLGLQECVHIEHYVSA
jgi:GNAT superfamily N-acetyltransferase